MDSFLNTLASSPVTTSVSLVACLMLLAGYYFFVIPMLSENKELKIKNLELQKQLVDSLTQTEKTLSSIDNSFGQFKELTNKSHSDTLTQLKLLISNDAKEQHDTHRQMLKELENSLDRLFKDQIKPDQMCEIRNTLMGFVSEVNSQLYAVQNTVTDVRSLCDNIKDKQSTLINGMIMATGGALAFGNANIGVK